MATAQRLTEREARDLNTDLGLTKAELNDLLGPQAPERKRSQTVRIETLRRRASRQYKYYRV